MSFGLYISGLVLLLAMCAPLVFAGVAARRVLLPAWSGPPARVAEAVMAIGLLTLIAQALGIVGLLKTAPLVAVCVLVGGGLAYFLGKRRVATDGTPLPAPSPDPLCVAAAVAAVGLVCAAWTARVVGSLESGILGVDTLWYHLPMAARFAQTASVAHVQFFDGEPVTSYYPANSSLLHALGMIVMKRDLVSPFLNMGWLALVLLSAWSIGRPRGRGPEAVVAVSLLLATPTLVTTQPGEAYNDIMGLALVLAAGTFLVHAEGRRAPIALAGVAIGLALGTKFTLLAPTVTLTLGVALLVRPGRRFATSAQFLGITLLFGGLWYLRNLLKVGNPLPGADLGIGPLALPSPEYTTPSFTLSQYLFNGRVWDTYFLPGFDYAFGPAWWGLVVLGAVGAILAIALGPTRAHRLLGLVAAVTAMVYVFTPQFLGVADGPLFFRYNLRYATPAIVLGLVLLPLVPPLSGRLARRGLMLLIGALLIAMQFDDRLWPTRHDRWAVAAAIAVLAAVGLAFAARRVRLPRALLAGAGAGLALAVVIAGYAVADRYMDRRYTSADLRDDSIPVATYRWAQGVSHARIGLSNMFLQYPLAGADLTNHVQYVGIGADHGGFRPPRSCTEWREALAEGDYDYVVTAPAGYPAAVGGEESQVTRWTRSDPRASTVLHEGRNVWLFKLNGPATPETCEIQVVPRPRGPAQIGTLAGSPTDGRLELEGRAPLRIDSKAGKGFVDRSEALNAGRVLVSGWAAGADGRPAARIVLVADGKVLGAVRPTTDRPDVAEDQGFEPGKFGYRVLVSHPGARALAADGDRLRVFAVSGRRAYPIQRLPAG